jgi:para-aminobenzoate synthetase
MLSVCCKKAGITLSSIQGGTQRIVEELYLDGKHLASSDVFWLDSSSQERSRFSFIGGRGGAMWKRVSYAMHAPLSDRKGGELVVVDAEEKTERHHCDSIWDWISQQSREFQVFDANLKELPFGFWGGLVGYLGYELKAESGGKAAHISPNADACFFIVDRYIVVDHKTGDIYIVAVYNGSHNRSSSEMWVDLTMSNLENLKGSDHKGETRTIASRNIDIKERHCHQRYLDKIEKCLEVGTNLE